VSAATQARASGSGTSSTASGTTPARLAVIDGLATEPLATVAPLSRNWSWLATSARRALLPNQRATISGHATWVYTARASPWRISSSGTEAWVIVSAELRSTGAAATRMLLWAASAWQGSWRTGPTGEAMPRRWRASTGAPCEGSVAEACISLADAYDHGSGVPRDRARATELLFRACGLGYELACSTALLRKQQGLNDAPQERSPAQQQDTDRAGRRESSKQ
jgi:TPR repeat protein